MSAQYPLIGTTTKSLQTTSDFSLNVITADGQMKAVSNLTTVGGILPSLSAYAAHMDAIVFGAIDMSSFVVRCPLCFL